MRLRQIHLVAVLFALAASLALAAPARADDSKDDEFVTSWFGAKIEVWYQPMLRLNATVGGNQDPTGVILPQNTKFDAHDDLGVHTNTPKPTFLDFEGGPVVLDGFVDTRWISIEGFWITPFQYSGQTVLTRTLSFAGISFQVSRPVETDLAQSIMGFDIKVNILNNRFVRLSPVVAVRAIAIDWTVKDATPGSPFKASTENVDFPISFGRYKVFPYPEAGGEVRVGYRDYIEGDLKVTGFYISYVGVQAWTALVDVGVTGYLPFFNNVGLRLGYRYYFFSARTSNQQGDKQFSADLRLSGMTAGLIARF